MIYGTENDVWKGSFYYHEEIEFFEIMGSNYHSDFENI